MATEGGSDGVVGGIVAIAAAATFIVLLSILAMILAMFLPLPAQIIWPAALPGVLVFTGPNFFKPAIEPVSAGAWVELGWIVIAVGYGIVTRHMVKRTSLFGWALVVVSFWLLPQTILVWSYVRGDWRRASTDAMRIRILSETPIGSSMDQVQAVIRREGWRVQRVDDFRGFLDQRVPGLDVITGAKHIEANAGDFQGLPFRSNVTIFWGFDGSGDLIDIWPWRTTNGL